ncbi:hypothetical protein OG203_25595 [Nocardia sp. NBC_01499]|uniref:hypothetical protein n=1 Tax=Nocardia sp. NBC_01499 TaxID=2903597 RepID=UPI00386973EE
MAEYEAWHVTYKRLCEYAYEDWDNEFTADEARIVGQAWGNSETPEFEAWADRGEVAITASVLAQAEEILDGLRMCAENHWPHEGEPWSQVAGMDRVVMFLRSQL